jgi:hypothetical protein
MKAVVTTLLSAAVLWSGTTGAFSQTNDTGRVLVPSNALKLSANKERCGTTTLRKEFMVPYAGVVRVRWQLTGDGRALVSAEITSTIDRCVSTNVTATYQQNTCDLRVLAGDLVQVSAGGSSPPDGSAISIACIKNVRIFFDAIDASGLGETLAN